MVSIPENPGQAVYSPFLKLTSHILLPVPAVIIYEKNTRPRSETGKDLVTSLVHNFNVQT